MGRKLYAHMTDEEKKTYLQKCRSRGGKTRAKSFTSDYQKSVRAKCSSEKCAANGSKGWHAAVEKYGLAQVESHVCAWRRDPKNFSEPMRHVVNLLTEHSINHYEIEYEFGDGKSIDLAWSNDKRGIEVAGHQFKPSFGETESRLAKLRAKIDALKVQGWDVFEYDPRQANEDARLLEWIGTTNGNGLSE